MVKIALAGGSGNVGSEIIAALLAAKKHDIVILSRKDAPDGVTTPGTTWVKANYENPEQLTQILQGVHTLLSFVTEQEDPKAPLSKNLIDAAVRAGVKRFAPSEWATSGLQHLGWYAYKGEVRRYLQELNQNEKILEYTLFQPGIFANYFTHPHKSAEHLHLMETPFDFDRRRAIVLDGAGNSRITLTTVQDLANVVARAIDFEGEWPVIGGIRGTTLSVSRLIALGEEVRGGTPFTLDYVNAQDLETGKWETSWLPRLDHPSFSPEQVEALSAVIVAGLCLAISAGAFESSDEWNQLLPDYQFTQVESFLAEAWQGKP